MGGGLVFAFKIYFHCILVKHTTAYFLFIVYALGMCKPVLSKVKDEIAHLFWEASHIATVHMQHGNHHAEDETAASAHEEKKNTTPATSKIADPVSIHLIAPDFYTPPGYSLQKQKFGDHICMVTTLPLDRYYPPPKLA